MTNEERLRKQRKLAGRIGASMRIAKPGYSGREATRAATEASREAREREVDPEGQLSEEERKRRAKHLLLARFNRGKLAKLNRRHPHSRPRRRGLDDGEWWIP